MTNSAIFEKLSGMGSMPTPSRVALEIMRLCKDESSSLGDVANVVETDPALTSELLKYANSALMSPGSRVASIHKATVKLGMQTVKNLALCFTLLSQNKNGVCQKFDYQAFWSRSLARAVAARSLSQGVNGIDPDELFTCGLLAHMGCLALASLFPEAYGLLLSEEPDNEALLLREHETFGIDHKKLCGELFHSWGLPTHFIIAASTYADRQSLDRSDIILAKICDILHLADLVADICMFKMDRAVQLEKAERYAQNIAIKGSDFAVIFDNIIEQWQKWGHVFQVATQDCPLYRKIKQAHDGSAHSLNATVDKEKLKILVADDDPMTLLSLERLLQNGGKTVYTSENGQDALNLALKKRPDMVITDWRMPKISGLDLCKQLRENPVTQHIYIMMLTGKESDDELVLALDAGADDFVVKPFTPRVLEARIQSGERIIRYQQKIHHDRELIEEIAARLTSANQKLETMAMTDVLTGLPNRRSVLSRLKEVVAESQRHREPLSCIMIDIDHFKQVNDNFGHDIGDIVLQNIASAFSSTVRSYDMVSRIGGEEFLVICARSTLNESRQLAERLRLAVEHLHVRVDDAIIKTTISLGVAAWNETMLDGEAMTKAADRALYQAKRRGRNRVEIDQTPN
jgi:diguanylate cyclase (GGDEF)-like protein